MSIDGKELPSVGAGDVLSIDIDMLSSVDFMIVYSDFYFIFKFKLNPKYPKTRNGLPPIQRLF